MKYKKIFLVLLLLFNFTFISTLPINATDVVYNQEQEECPQGAICTYKLDKNLGVYMLASINENENEVNMFADSGTGTVVPQMFMELYYESGWTGTTVIYPDQRSFAHSNIKSMNIFWHTEYARSEYVSVEFSFTLNHTSHAFNKIESITINGQSVSEYSISGDKLWLKETVKAQREDSIMNVWISYTQPINFNDTITLSCKTTIDENGATHGLLNGIIQFVRSISYTINDVFNVLTNIPNMIAQALSSFFEMLRTSIENIGSSITNAVNKIQSWLNDLLNGIINGLKSLFIPSDDYFKNYFDSLYDFFSEKLGILIMPIDILGSLMNNILNLDNGDGYIHIPKIEFMKHTLIPKTDYNLKVDVEQVMGNYYEMYYLITDVIIYFMLFNMAKKKFDEIVRGTN